MYFSCINLMDVLSEKYERIIFMLVLSHFRPYLSRGYKKSTIFLSNPTIFKWYVHCLPPASDTFFFLWGGLTNFSALR